LFVTVKLASVNQTFSRIFLSFHLRFEIDGEPQTFAQDRGSSLGLRAETICGANWKRKLQ